MGFGSEFGRLEKSPFVGGSLLVVEDARACGEAGSSADGDEVAERWVDGADVVYGWNGGWETVT